MAPRVGGCFSPRCGCFGGDARDAPFLSIPGAGPHRPLPGIRPYFFFPPPPASRITQAPFPRFSLFSPVFHGGPQLHWPPPLFLLAAPTTKCFFWLFCQLFFVPQLEGNTGIGPSSGTVLAVPLCKKNPGAPRRFPRKMGHPRSRKSVSSAQKSSGPPTNKKNFFSFFVVFHRPRPSPKSFAPHRPPKAKMVPPSPAGPFGNH